MVKMSKAYCILLLLTAGKFGTSAPKSGEVKSFTEKEKPKEEQNFLSTLVGGQYAGKDQFPWIVSITYRDKHVCSGSIMSVNWIISAGRCFQHHNMRGYLVTAGILILGEETIDTQTSHIRDLIMHPTDKNPATFLKNYDIVLAVLQNRFLFTDTVMPVVLPIPNKEFSGSALVAGWGYTKIRPFKQSYILQYLTVNVVPMQECIKMYNITNELQDYVCALPSDAPGSSACLGDSGGPVIKQGILIGVVSWGSKLCTTNPKDSVSNIYLGVSSFIGFIKQYVKNYNEYRSKDRTLSSC